MSTRAVKINVKLNGTNRSLRHLYRTFNRMYFDNKLDNNVAVCFNKSAHVRWAGCYTPELEVIHINPAFRHFRRITCMILLHEMAHVAAQTENHARKFQRVMHALADCGAFEELW